MVQFYLLTSMEAALAEFAALNNGNDMELDDDKDFSDKAGTWHALLHFQKLIPHAHIYVSAY